MDNLYFRKSKKFKLDLNIRLLKKDMYKFFFWIIFYHCHKLDSILEDFLPKYRIIYLLINRKEIEKILDGIWYLNYINSIGYIFSYLTDYKWSYDVFIDVKEMYWKKMYKKLIINKEFDELFRYVKKFWMTFVEFMKEIMPDLYQDYFYFSYYFQKFSYN